jgi:hypothetical protein
MESILNKYSGNKKKIAFALFFTSVCLIIVLFFPGFESSETCYSESGEKYTIVISKPINNRFWRITCEVPIEVSKDSLWNFCLSERFLEKAHPFCEYHSNTHFKAEDGLPYDTITYYSDVALIRDFQGITEKDSFWLDILQINENDSKNKLANVVWQFKELKEGRSALLSISVDIEVLKATPFIEWSFYHIHGNFSAMSDYLSSLTNGIKFHLETGENVKKNQFGSHKWLSPEYEK